MSPTLGNLPKTVFESIEYFSGYLNSGDLFALKPSVYKSNIPGNPQLLHKDEVDTLTAMQANRGDRHFFGDPCTTELFYPPTSFTSSRTGCLLPKVNSPPQTGLLPASPWKPTASWGTLPQPRPSPTAGPWWQQALSRCCHLSPPGGSLCQLLHSGVPPRVHWAGLASQHHCRLRKTWSLSLVPRGQLRGDL